MTSGDDVVVVPHTLVKDTKLDESVAHHVRVGCQSLSHLRHGVVHDLFPVVVVQVDNLKRQTILGRHGTRHLEVLLDGASEVGLIPFGANLDVPQIRSHSLLDKQGHSHRTIDTATEQCCHFLSV